MEDCTHCIVPDDPVAVPVVDLAEALAGYHERVREREESVAVGLALDLRGHEAGEGWPERMHLEPKLAGRGAVHPREEGLRGGEVVARHVGHQVAARLVEIFPQKSAKCVCSNHPIPDQSMHRCGIRDIPRPKIACSWITLRRCSPLPESLFLEYGPFPTVAALIS